MSSRVHQIQTFKIKRRNSSNYLFSWTRPSQTSQKTSAAPIFKLLYDLASLVAFWRGTNKEPEPFQELKETIGVFRNEVSSAVQSKLLCWLQSKFIHNLRHKMESQDYRKKPPKTAPLMVLHGPWEPRYPGAGADVASSSSNALSLCWAIYWWDDVVFQTLSKWRLTFSTEARVVRVKHYHAGCCTCFCLYLEKGSSLIALTLVAKVL